jgi:hypothetical protein
MAISYIQAIGNGFPAVQCHALGDGTIYSNIVWDAGAPLPTQAILDAWIAANPEVPSSITKYQFRKLFTLPERVAIDNVADNTTIPAEYKAMILTMYKDIDAALEIELTSSDMQQGIFLLEQLGLLVSGRAAQILSNQPPL